MWLIPLLLILLVPACAQETETNTVIDFADSVKIVRELLQSNSLTQILENPEPEQLDFLINNFSPAEIAFESEVLNCSMPVALFCFCSFCDKSFLIKKIDGKYPNHKIVFLDVIQFPFIADSLGINAWPALFIVHKRDMKMVSFIF